MSMKQVDKKAEEARELFLQGYNCAQSVFCVFAEEYGIPRELALKLSASFGGGVGRLRNVCGTVSAMAMLAGLEEGQTAPNDPEQKRRNYQLVQRVAERFRREHGSIICAELLQLRKGAPTPPTPDERTAEYYKSRPCLRLIESAARIWQEKKESRGMLEE
jgi:C_GCAxxG_C_C family probable redox protein